MLNTLNKDRQFIELIIEIRKINCSCLSSSQILLVCPYIVGTLIYFVSGLRQIHHENKGHKGNQILGHLKLQLQPQRGSHMCFRNEHEVIGGCYMSWSQN